MVTFSQPEADTYEDDGAETWKPKDGSPQQIAGTVLERKEVTRKDGTPVELIKLETKTGERWLVWVSATMVKQCVKRDDPQPGDLWGIEYQGPRSLGGGKNLDQYGSYHKPAAGAPAAKPAPDMTSGPKDSPGYLADDDPF